MVAAFMPSVRIPTDSLGSGTMLTSPSARQAAQSPAEPTYFTRDGVYYELRIWSEGEWARIPAEARPPADHVPGLGWVGGVFRGTLN